MAQIKSTGRAVFTWTVAVLLFSSAFSARAALSLPNSDSLDSTVMPGDDFYGYVNDVWMEQTSIPTDISLWGDMRRLREDAAFRVREVLDKAAMAPANADERKVGEFYSSFMDERTTEAKGLTPLVAPLKAVYGMRTRDDLARAFARLGRIAPLFGFGGYPGSQSSFPISLGITIDLKEPTQYAVELSQGGLGLPDRVYYRVDDPKTSAARAAYKTYLSTLYSLAGLSRSSARADAVFALEQQIAAAQLDSADTEDSTKTYNLLTQRELSRKPGAFPGPPISRAQASARTTSSLSKSPQC